MRGAIYVKYDGPVRFPDSGVVLTPLVASEASKGLCRVDDILGYVSYPVRSVLVRGPQRPAAALEGLLGIQRTRILRALWRPTSIGTLADILRAVRPAPPRTTSTRYKQPASSSATATDAPYSLTAQHAERHCSNSMKTPPPAVTPRCHHPRHRSSDSRRDPACREDILLYLLKGGAARRRRPCRRLRPGQPR